MAADNRIFCVQDMEKTTIPFDREISCFEQSMKMSTMSKRSLSITEKYNLATSYCQFKKNPHPHKSLFVDTLNKGEINMCPECFCCQCMEYVVVNRINDQGGKIY